MKLYEASARCAELAFAYAGDGCYDPTAHIKPREATKDALLSMALVLDAVADDWGLDLVAELTKARNEKED